MYEIGITEINTHVRRLGYVSAILKLLAHKTLSESLLYKRLERWSLNHEIAILTRRRTIFGCSPGCFTASQGYPNQPMLPNTIGSASG